ncbi:MAG: CAP domain-containing protein [Gemmatimonadota bacterium]
MERSVHDLINAHRTSAGLPPLESEGVLGSLAREHSERMADGERLFSHTGFDARVRAARAALPVSAMSENVATNNYSAAEAADRVVSGWIGSPGHRKNLEGDFELAGVGIARNPQGDYFVTQIYAAKSREQRSGLLAYHPAQHAVEGAREGLLVLRAVRAGTAGLHAGSPQ